MLNIDFFKKYLEKTFPHIEFDIQPVVDILQNLDQNHQTIYYGVVDGSYGNLEVHYRGNVLEHMFGVNPVFFDHIGPSNPSDNFQFIGYGAYPLP